MKVWLCDVKKNTECKKSICQTYCKHTTNKEYRASWLKRFIKGVANYVNSS